MEHIKTYNSIKHQATNVIIEGPIPASTLEQYNFHHDLTSFRPSDKQFQALLGIADLPDGRINIARTEDSIIGYVM